MSKASAAERAIARAIEEGTAEVRAELRVAQQRIQQLEGLLGRIAAIATQPTVALPQVAVPRADLPPEVQSMMSLPVEPPIRLILLMTRRKADGSERAFGDML